MGCTNEVRRNKFLGYRDIYDTKRDIIDENDHAKQYQKSKKKEKQEEGEIYRAEVLI